ncbi:hypothetical protein M501DRAFT_998132 [Patellaria atrata CBS 101060]|uniref:Calcium-channel protein CCH1 n=1 Tax=Patellaria atrata CBS 101060 TaxID=1346257 RepID=A0A9P4SFH7_9PEZI|nr:hypothetical protein M501DRAFT_998132 [Patellaria atrata CBS 101060]
MAPQNKHRDGEDIDPEDLSNKQESSSPELYDLSLDELPEATLRIYDTTIPTRKRHQVEEHYNLSTTLDNNLLFPSPHESHGFENNLALSLSLNPPYLRPGDPVTHIKSVPDGLNTHSSRLITLPDGIILTPIAIDSRLETHSDRGSLSLETHQRTSKNDGLQLSQKDNDYISANEEIQAQTDNQRPFRSGSIFHEMSLRVTTLKDENHSAVHKLVENDQESKSHKYDPLKGRTLGVFSSSNIIRRRAFDILTHPLTEPFVLLLLIAQMIISIVETSRNLRSPETRPSWSGSSIDYAYLSIFILYTLEMFIKIIALGSFFTPPEYRQGQSRKNAFYTIITRERFRFFAPQRPHFPKNIHQNRTSHVIETRPSILEGVTVPKHYVPQARYPFFRSGYNQLDFISVSAFWIALALRLHGQEVKRYVSVFQMLSSLRLLRLLFLTSGTTRLIRTMRKAAPLLAYTSFFFAFAWLLFGLIGVQSFASGLKRSCIWIGPGRISANYTSAQHCGGNIDNRNYKSSWLTSEGAYSTDTPDGYLCQPGSLCVEKRNPFNDTVSFDNILHSLEQVYIILSTNTFSDTLYALTMSKSLAAVFYFVVTFIILSLCLANQFTSIIVYYYAVTKDEDQSKAFKEDDKKSNASTVHNPVETIDQEETGVTRRIVTSITRIWFKKLDPVWIIVILYGLLVQCFRTANMTSTRQLFLDTSERVVTATLFIEIILRLAMGKKLFFKNGRDIMDLVLALATAIIQLPAIHNSGQVYAWLTIFQILRIYRITLVLSPSRELLLVVFQDIAPLLRFFLFIALTTLIFAIFGAQLFGGHIPEDRSDGQWINVHFSTLYNSFFGIYQILSGRDWTTILYDITGSEKSHNLAWFGATFCIIFSMLSLFLLRNLCLAILRGSFEISEDEKRLSQVKKFLKQKYNNEQRGTSITDGLAHWYENTLQQMGHIPELTSILFHNSGEELGSDDEPPRDSMRDGLKAIEQIPPLVANIRSLLNFLRRPFNNPFFTQAENWFDDSDDPIMAAKNIVIRSERIRKLQREYLRAHPNFNNSLFIFTPANRFRKICMRLLGPVVGERIEGVVPTKGLWYFFSLLIYLSILAQTILTCIATPLYQRRYFEEHNFSMNNWITMSDLGFCVIFTIEFLVSTVANGFFYTPNGYVRSLWGSSSFSVLIVQWVILGSSILHGGATSRTIGTLKALRSIRLLQLVHKPQISSDFSSFFISGRKRLFSAILVAFFILLGSSIYALNLFNGQMLACNDRGNGITSVSQCSNEYLSKPLGWNILTPRYTTNPGYSFDNFGASLFILFQILSLEGWVEVMWNTMDATSPGMPRTHGSSKWNSIFFIFFNLLSLFFILGLFTAVFMYNYAFETGVAHDSPEQRLWGEMKELLRTISPVYAPSPKENRNRWQLWCSQRGRNHGVWYGLISCALVFQLIIMCMEFYPQSEIWHRSKDALYFILVLLYITDILIRICGGTWTINYHHNPWDLYGAITVTGALITNILVLVNWDRRVYQLSHGLFLVFLMGLLIPRVRVLKRIFQTTVIGLNSTYHILLVWLVFYVIYAIAFTQCFGLTKFNRHENINVNFRSTSKTFVLLFRMSFGKGWNDIMEDFATMRFPTCVPTTTPFSEDCGSAGWARFLFISWNILNKFIFINMIIAIIYNSVNSVYHQTTGVTLLSIDEIRRFQEVWARFDPKGTKYISKEDIPHVLSQLSGIFEMKIYTGESTIPQIINACKTDTQVPHLPGTASRTIINLDLDRLNQCIADIDVAAIRRRRKRYRLLHEELMVSADPDKGLHITRMLQILAYYTLVDETTTYLRLEEFLRRRARLHRIEEAVRRELVTGFLKVIYWSGRFRGRKRGNLDSFSSYWGSLAGA